MFEALRHNFAYNWKNNRRKAMKDLTAWFLFGAIILVFIFWGMQRNQQMGAGVGGAAATVNNDSISPLQLNDAIENLKRDPRMEQLQQLGPETARQMLSRQAMSQLIELELIRQANVRNHIMTSDAEVRDVITTIPAFNEKGQFRRDYYMGYLSNVHKSPGEFEKEIRNQQALHKMVGIFGAALHPLDLSKEKQKSLESLKANMEFVSVPTDALVIPEMIATADVKKFVDDPANKAKIKDYFETHKADFTKDEQIKARHILIQAKAGDPKAEASAMAKIKDIQAKAKTEDFAKLATAYSEDPGSKTSGGLLEFFSRGRMVKEFEDAAFSQPAGQVGEPVKTSYGYHLIKVLEKKPAHSDTLESAQDTIAEHLIARDRTQADMQALEAALKKGDLALINKFVSDHKLKWEETGVFSIDAQAVPKVGQNDEMALQAFKLTPEHPLAQSLVRQGPRAYITRYKAAGADPKISPKSDETAAMMREMMAGRQSEDTLQSWLNDMRKNSKIVINGSMPSNSGPPESAD